MLLFVHKKKVFLPFQKIGYVHPMVTRSEYEPGDYVRHPQAPDWGLGQVQSAIGERVTVMFENMGKVVLDTAMVTLDRVDLRKLPPGTTF